MVEAVAAQRGHSRFMIAYIISKVKHEGFVPFFPIHQVSSTPNPAHYFPSSDVLFSYKLQESDLECRDRSICGNQKQILAHLRHHTE